jgi:anti-sigma factor RsiW
VTTSGQDEDVTMQCNQTQTLIPSYLDGELSETQAAPLRKHLLDCQPCRAAAQGGKALKRWFVEDEPTAFPVGFAARVARRAFAGDTGTGEPFAETVAAQAGPGEGGRLLHFVLWTTAAAAGLLLTLSIGLRGLTLPDTRDARADSTTEPLGVDQALDQLDELNRAEAAGAATDDMADEARAR